MLKRVLVIFRNEGLLYMFRHSFAYVFQNILSYETYYLIIMAIKNGGITSKKQIDFAGELTFRWIESNVQADEVAREFEDFRSYTTNARQILDCGGYASCNYVGKELAGFSWMADTATAMKALTNLPLYVDFDRKEMYAGYAYTRPKFRRKGLRYYSLLFKYQNLLKKGLETERSAIRANNYVSIKANSDRQGHVVYAKAHYLRFLGFKFWKEVPMNITTKELADKMNRTS